MFLSRKFGAAMIVAGTCIGAGMLAIPSTLASCGFFIGSVLIFCIWGLMTFTALVLVEVNLQMKEGSNFIEMTNQTLGFAGVCVVWACYVLLLYSLVAAYTVGGGSLITTILTNFGLTLSEKIGGIIFIFIFGIFIYTGTRIVDHVNKIMFAGKLLALFLIVLVLLPHISINHLEYKIKTPSFIWATLPILLTSFGFHHIIPTLRVYLGSDRKSLRHAIIFGSAIPLVVYLIWIFATLGSIPVATEGGILGKQNSEITSIIINYFSGSSRYIPTISFLFGFFALATSFLGVALGLFDFNRRTYKISNNLCKHKSLVFIITFFPAYLYAIIYPDGFRIALGYASIFVAILQVALPVIMLWVINYRKNNITFCTSIITIAIILIAIVIIILQILSSFSLLPVLEVK